MQNAAAPHVAPHVVSHVTTQSASRDALQAASRAALQDAPPDAQDRSQATSHVTSSDTSSVAVAPHIESSDASSVALVCVDPARVAEVWPHVAPLIARALARGGFDARAAGASAHDPSTHDPSIDDSSAHSSAPDLARRLRTGAALLWLAWDGATILAAAVTALDIIDGVKCCTLIACGGRDFARFGHLIAGLERYAVAEGCARMRICGRKGWLRRLPDYALARVIIEKRL